MGDSGSAAHVLKESDTNAISSTNANLLAQQIKTPSKTYENYEKFIQEQQSSDDSFDGIRWRASPRKAISKGVNGGAIVSVEEYRIATEKGRRTEAVVHISQ